MEFNALHPTQSIREEGWRNEPNPFAIKQKAKPGHSYTDKHIFVYANQLWYDIDATTNMLGRARRGNQTNQEEIVPTSENDQERPLFYRWFDKYISKIETILTAYIMKPQGRVRDNALKEWDEKELWLRFPDYWDDTRYDTLVKCIHDYIVVGALYEYFALTLTSKDPVTIDKLTQLDEMELDLIEAANSAKAGSMIHTLKPFG